MSKNLYVCLSGNGSRNAFVTDEPLTTAQKALYTIIFKVTPTTEGLEFEQIKSAYALNFPKFVIPVPELDPDNWVMTFYGEMPPLKLEHGNLLTIDGTGQVILECTHPNSFKFNQEG